MNSFHGHDVMQMMMETDQAFSYQGLITAIEMKFGSEARFHTCSSEGMTGAQLIEFLMARGKIVETPAGLRLGGGMCGDHH
ncbi:MAG: YecH family protein [Oligoflexia bacterium]|nr:YecH family protein [Oligoflexia bacterium]